MRVSEVSTCPEAGIMNDGLGAVGSYMLYGRCQ